MPKGAQVQDRQEALRFNRSRWEEVIADPQVVQWQGRVETNEYGQMIMTPPPSGDHSFRIRLVMRQLESLIGGVALPECPILTGDGVRAADVGWFSQERFRSVCGQTVFEMAPEICVEVLSPSNTHAEMANKRRLYFDAGAKEVWHIGLEGEVQVFEEPSEGLTIPRSSLCPDFPDRVDTSRNV